MYTSSVRLHSKSSSALDDFCSFRAHSFKHCTLGAFDSSRLYSKLQLEVSFIKMKWCCRCTTITTIRFGPLFVIITSQHRSLPPVSIECSWKMHVYLTNSSLDKCVVLAHEMNNRLRHQQCSRATTGLRLKRLWRRRSWFSSRKKRKK